MAESSPPIYDKYHFETELNEAKIRFRDFQETRRRMDDLLNRKAQTILPPELTAVQEGIDYRTPLIDKASGDWQDILTTNPTNFDLHPVSQTQAAQEQGRRILLWMTRGWEYENPQRKWDRGRGEGQVRHGVSFARLCYRPPVEPETKAEDPEDSLKERDAEMRHRPHPFYWKDMDLYGCYYVGDETEENGPGWFAYEFELPYISARNEYVRKTGDRDSYLEWDSSGKLGWYGETQAVRSDTSEQLTQYSRLIRVVMIDCEDPGGRECPLPGCEHKQRIIRVYCTDPNSSGQELTDETLFEEYDSPFPGCSFFAVGGRMSLAFRNPETRFRPMLNTLYVEGQYENYLTTLLVTAMRRDYGPEGLYVDGSTTDPRNVPEDSDKMLDFSALTDGKVQWLPGELKKIPYALSPHMLPELNLHREAMSAGMPNAHLTGTANTEASNATGTAFLANEAQASLPASTLLAQTDAAILRSRRYEFHALRVWGLSDPKGAPTKYYAVMTGNNKNVTYMGTQAKAGEVIEVSAKDFEDFDFDLEITTENETLAQQQARWLMTWDQYSKGVATPEDLIRAAGHRDVEGQKEKLRVAGLHAEFQPIQDHLDVQYLLEAMTRLSGVNPDGTPKTDFTYLLQQPQAPLLAGSEGGGGGAPPGGSMGTNNIVTPPNSQMGRSAQQVAFAAGNPSLGTAAGGSGSQ